LSTTYAPTAILLRAVGGDDANPLLPKKILAERAIYISKARNLYTKYANTGATETTKAAGEEAAHEVPVAAATEAGATDAPVAAAAAATDEAVEVPAGGSEPSAAPAAPLRPQPSRPRPLDTAAPAADADAAARALPVAAVAAWLLQVMELELVGEVRRAVCNIAAAARPRLPLAPSSSPTHPSPHAPSYMRTHLQDEVLVLALPGDDRGKQDSAASLRLLRDSAMGSPYKTANRCDPLWHLLTHHYTPGNSSFLSPPTNYHHPFHYVFRYLISETPGYHRDAFFCLYRGALRLPIAVDLPPPSFTSPKKAPAPARRAVGSPQAQMQAQAQPSPAAAKAAYEALFSPLVRSLGTVTETKAGQWGFQVAPVPVLLTMKAVSVRDAQGTGFTTTLALSAVAATGAFALGAASVPATLTSAMLLDTQLAEEYVEALAPKLSLVVPYDWDGSDAAVKVAVAAYH